MALAETSALLQELTAAGQGLAESHGLDEFQRLAKEVCASVSLSVQQLAAAREALQGATADTWEQLGAEGVAVADVGRCACGVRAHAARVHCSGSGGAGRLRCSW